MKPNRIRLFTPRLSALVVCLGLALPSTHSLANQNELTGVKSEISRQQKSLSAQQKELDTLQNHCVSKRLAFLMSRKKSKQQRQLLLKPTAT
ncbi:hypothetical protein JCM19235_28 [Vibrio maritimus]|uniref:Uncharacterized protein n=1 Tax=Vibrio maritimus TaxID=990268 RepID=A0A090S6U5_9VIBR|nr:hypothetical protein JCM19235_28 [Vibrio maritimus]